MTYAIVNFDHLKVPSDVSIKVVAEPLKRPNGGIVLKLTLHSNENKVILTLNEEQGDRIWDLLDQVLEDVQRKGA